ncbi:carboxypeptidase-like regulatory domain-containing protein [Psychroserpens mesophilus]|uniref:carboxypeptidase-like regulatory domain-containing protein n=1 Tax=Psychroserpens mesophilus TaxID=325473 RepID=UPI003D64C2C0
MKVIYQLFFFLIFITTAQAQDLTVTVIDADTKEPIPFVAIQTAQYKGVMSNDEGVFVINIEDVSDNQISLSCLGYNPLTIPLEDIKNSNFIIRLKSAVNELDTVYLSNSRPNVNSIISNVNKNLKLNYKSDSLSYQLFFRETVYVDFEKLELEVNKASHFKKKQLEDVNTQLANMGTEVQNSNIVYFKDFSGDLHVLDNANKKIKVDKATQIINSKKDFSIDNIQKEGQRIILKYLDTTKTFKLKSGLFKIEDSLSLANANDKDKFNEFEIDNLKGNASTLMQRSQTDSNSILRKVLDAENYNYTISNITFEEEETIYLIEFTPRRSRAKFSGSMYVSDKSFAVLKLDYQYSEGKRGYKLNLRLLFGVKYIENVKQGTIIFKPNEQNYYEPRYIKSETGQYFYVNRPLKFIENSNDRNKTEFNFKIEGNSKNREELLFISIDAIDMNAFNTITEPKTIKFESLRAYDSNTWSGIETLAPTKELKAIKVKD